MNENKNVINGYHTFNTVAIDDNNKQLHLVDTKVYSNREPNFVSIDTLELYNKGVLQESEDPELRERAETIKQLLETDDYINVSKITKEQLEKTSQAFKQEQPDAQITHILDAGFDNNDLFDYIDKTLEDKFVIRLKLSRNSDEIYFDDNGKEKYAKIIKKQFANKKCFSIQKTQINGKIYQQANCLIEYENFSGPVDTVVRITLYDRKRQKIFKNSMLLLTNLDVNTHELAHGIYLTYLKRSKIEGVFKFLKDVLGWEEFQVRDFESITNITARCFFIGGYFYEIESELIKDTTIQCICDLGGGKGKYTRYYFLQGLAKIRNE